MVDEYDSSSFDIVREEFARRTDDTIGMLEAEERRLSEERDRDRDTIRGMEPRTVQERYDAGLLRGAELARYERFLRQQGGETAEEREVRIQANIAKRLLMEMTNDDSVTLTPEMVEVINDPELRMTTNGEVTKLTGRDVIRRSGQFSRQALLPRTGDPGVRKTTKKKRKVSRYQKEFGKQLKMLKTKHPRTPITRLMKRAHSATRKAMK